MRIVLMFGAILGGMDIGMNGFQRLGSSQPGHSFSFVIALVHTVPMPLLRHPMFPKLPKTMRNCAKMISMALPDIYGSIPEGFS